MDRRRVIDEAISTNELLSELDWDKLLWMPGEKKFFLPSIELADFKPLLYFNNRWEEAIKELTAASRRTPNPLLEGRWEGFCDECLGHEYLGIQRTREPNFSGGRRIRVPLEIPANQRFNADDRKEIVRPSFYTAFDWAKKP